MADKQEQVSSLIHSIPFGNLIGGPLSACISAQADAAQVALNYVRAVSMKRLDNGDNDDEAIFEPETISFSFVVNGQPRVMIVPLLTIIPVPFIRIEHVDLSFTADITASDKNKFEAKYTAPNREQTGEETTEVQVENVIEVDIHAVTSEMPSGLARLLEVFSTQLFQVEDMTPDEVEKIRQTNQVAPAAETPEPEPEPLKPAVHTESEKKQLRDAYKKYMKEGRYKEAREKRNQIIWTHTGVEARTLLRASTKPDANIPWMIRVTESLQDNPDCEYDPKLSLAENIRQQEKLQKTNRKKLRSDLLFAMKLAKKMYPNTIDSTKGKMVFKDVWKKHTHFKNGWYTFGGSKEEGALKYFVNWIILLEKGREEKARKEAEEKAQKEAEEKAKKEAEEKAKKEAEEKAKKEAEEKAQKELEEKLRKEAEEKRKKEAEAKAKKEAEEKAKAETLAKAKAATEELIKKMNAAKEAKAKKEAEEEAKKEAEEKAKKEALEKAAKEALAKAQKEAAEKLKKEAEEKAKEKAKKEMAEKAKNALEEIKKRVSEATNTSIKRVPTLTRKTRKK